jgi:hypothetical protein
VWGSTRPRIGPAPARGWTRQSARPFPERRFTGVTFSIQIATWELPSN